MELHRRIRTLRIRRGLTGMELARRTGVSPSYVSLIEHGDKTPSEDVAVRIARVLGEREDLYRVWAATARMDEATRQAVLRMRGGEPAPLSAEPEPPRRGKSEFAGARRTPGRPRIAEDFEFPVAHDLGDDARRQTSRIPLLAPGAAPSADPPPPEETEALVAFDARLIERPSAAGLVALRVDETNGRDVVSWLWPGDLVVLDRRPAGFDAASLHAFRLPEGLRLARAGLAPAMLLLLPDPSRSDAPRTIPLAGESGLAQILFGTVLWSGRLWRR